MFFCVDHSIVHSIYEKFYNLVDELYYFKNTGVSDYLDWLPKRIMKEKINKWKEL